MKQIWKVCWRQYSVIIILVCIIGADVGIVFTNVFSIYSIDTHWASEVLQYREKQERVGAAIQICETRNIFDEVECIISAKAVSDIYAENGDYNLAWNIPFMKGYTVTITKKEITSP